MIERIPTNPTIQAVVGMLLGEIFQAPSVQERQVRDTIPDAMSSAVFSERPRLADLPSPFQLPSLYRPWTFSRELQSPQWNRRSSVELGEELIENCQTITVAYEQYFFDELLRDVHRWKSAIQSKASEFDHLKPAAYIVTMRSYLEKVKHRLEGKYIRRASEFGRQHWRLQGLVRHLIEDARGLDGEVVRKWSDALEKSAWLVRDVEQLLFSLEHELFYLSCIAEKDDLKNALAYFAPIWISTLSDCMGHVLRLNLLRSSTKKLSFVQGVIPTIPLPQSLQKDFFRITNGLFLHTIRHVEVSSLPEKDRVIKIDTSLDGSRLWIIIEEPLTAVSQEQWKNGESVRMKDLERFRKVAGRHGWAIGRMLDEDQGRARTFLFLSTEGWDLSASDDGAKLGRSRLDTIPDAEQHDIADAHPDLLDRFFPKRTSFSRISSGSRTGTEFWQGASAISPWRTLSFDPVPQRSLIALPVAHGVQYLLPCLFTPIR